MVMRRGGNSRRRVWCLTAALVVAVGVSGCSGSTHSAGPEVDVTVRDFKIEVPATIPTGNVTFVIHGAGPTLHEFNVARTDVQDLRTMRADDDSLNDAPDTPTPHCVHEPA